MIDLAVDVLAYPTEQDLPQSTFRHWRDQCKLRLREWCNPLVAREFRDVKAGLPVLERCCELVPRLPYKVYRPYMSARLDARRRLDALHTHYRFMSDLGLDRLLYRAARQSIVLGQLDGKSGQQYEIRLQAAHYLMQEGELVLQLALDDQLIYAVAFTFMEEGAQRVLALGCVQGGNSEHAAELVRNATRELHGLRPKNLLMRVLLDVAARAHCSKLVLVGNDNRAVTRSLREGKVFADYDAFWRECGARARADGDFELAPHAAGPTDLNDVASKKRAEVRRRDALAIAASDIVAAALALQGRA